MTWVGWGILALLLLIIGIWLDLRAQFRRLEWQHERQRVAWGHYSAQLRQALRRLDAGRRS